MHEVFPPESIPSALLAGLHPPEDAAVWQVTPDFALAVTVDVFTPVVDDPYIYGAIAAANSMSDIYAMGGQPFLALNVLAVPPQWPPEVAQTILRGGAEKVWEAGAYLVGGHTLQDEEPKYGLVVLGRVDPARMLRKGRLRPGDLLVMTKPLGMGTITTALKQGKAEPRHVDLAQEWMMRLNRLASEVALAAGVQAATDITGFGLLGHAWEMAQASKVALEFVWERIPILDPAHRYAEQGLFPGGTYANRETYAPHVTFPEDIRQEDQLLLFDAQTSGGLLLGVSETLWPRFRDAARKRGLMYWRVGRVLEGTPHLYIRRAR